MERSQPSEGFNDTLSRFLLPERTPHMPTHDRFSSGPWESEPPGLLLIEWTCAVQVVLVAVGKGLPVLLVLQLQGRNPNFTAGVYTQGDRCAKLQRNHCKLIEQSVSGHFVCISLK